MVCKKGWKMKVFITQLCLTLSTPWTVAFQAPLSMGFSRQEYSSGLLFPPPGALLDSGVETSSPALQADSWLSEPPRSILVCKLHLVL